MSVGSRVKKNGCLKGRSLEAAGGGLSLPPINDLWVSMATPSHIGISLVVKRIDTYITFGDVG